MEKNRTIIVPAGIGDILWVISKLVNTGERFKFLISDTNPRRSKPLLDLLPQVVHSAEYFPVDYRSIVNNNTTNRIAEWSKIKNQKIILSANEHLEEGRRIEDFLPDLETRFLLEYSISRYDKLFLLDPKKKYIGLYTSSSLNSAHYGAWEADEWFHLALFLDRRAKELGLEVVFVLIGATYDQDLLNVLTIKLADHQIKNVHLIGESLGSVVEVLKKLDYFVGFPSGLSILNESLGKDGTMFYGPHHLRLMGTWANPNRIADSRIHETQFVPPKQIYDWLVKTYEIYENSQT